MKHEAPLKSKAYTRLLRITEEKGSEELRSYLRELLYRINAPEHLTAFSWLTGRIDSIFNEIEDYIVDEEDKNFIQETKIWLDWFLENKIEIEKDMPEYFSIIPKDSEENPMINRGVERNCLYSALFQSQKDPDAIEKWNLLAGHYLMSYSKVFRRNIGIDDYENYSGKKHIPCFLNQPYPSALCLRQISGSSKSDLFDFLQLDISTLYFAKEAKKILKEEDTFDLDILGPILRFICKAQKITHWRETNSGGGGSKGVKRRKPYPGYIDIGGGGGIRQTDIGDADDDWDDWGGADIVVIPELTEDETAEIINADLIPEELDSGDRLLLSEHDCNDTKVSAMSIALAAKGKQKHLSMQSQFLPWRYPLLSLYEVRELQSYLKIETKKLFNIKGKLSLDESNRLECLLIIQAVLWTGSSVDRVCKSKIIKKKSTNPTIGLAIYKHENNIDASIKYEWRVLSTFPSYLSIPKYNKEIVLNRAKYFYMPDVFSVAENINKYREKYQAVKKRRSIFNGERKKYIKSINKILSEISNCDRLTVRKIESFIFYQIASESNNVTAASMITGFDHSLVQTKLFYTSHKLEYLRNIYLKAISPLLLETEKHISKRTVAALKKEQVIGARNCVSMDGYQQSISNIKKSLGEMKKYNGWDEFVNYHNVYTVYVILMFNFATAARSIRTPLIRFDEIDPILGITSISDKDTKPPYHARLIWIPDMVRKQLEVYDNHISSVRAFINTKYLGNNSYHADKDCFFISESGRAEEVKPSNFEKYSKDYLDAPANAHRRFLRTKLLERNQPVESVDALLGHWSLGEEPWSIYSSFNISDYIKTLKTNLVPLMKEMGFKNIKSQLIKGL